MLRLSLLFLVVGLIAALFAFGGTVPDAAQEARILFFVFVGLAVLALVGKFFWKQSPRNLA